METRTSASLAWFVLLALLLHLGASYLTLPKGRDLNVARLPAKKERQFVIEKAPEEKVDPKDKPIVQTSRAKKDEEADQEKAKYAGEFRNRVKKETQSGRRGRFQERENQQRPGRAGGLADNFGSDEQVTDEAGEPAPPPGLSMRDLMAYSASPNALDKDVAEGNETLLNTDQVLYASFFNRIADDIYDTWVSHVREAFRVAEYVANRRLPPKVYFTRLNIFMNASGIVTSITVLESSGVPELDEAAKKAFWDREPFSNPPVNMLGDDGLLKFVYGFRADYRTSFFNITPWST